MKPNERLAQLNSIYLSYAERTVLQDINLDIRQGQIITVIGPNGAGKTSLIKILLGLIKPSSGQVELQKKIRIGYMPQKLQLHDSLPLTVGRFLQLAKRIPRQQQLEQLQEVGVPHLIDSSIHSLSGGELQRVMLARALLNDPQLLVLDEPLQGVDVTGQIELYELLQRIRDKYNCAVLMVSHDLHLVMAATDEVLCINTHVCCSGHPDNVSQHPAYLELFGLKAEDALAVYTHQHDHTHDVSGLPTSCDTCPIEQHKHTDQEHKHG